MSLNKLVKDELSGSIAKSYVAQICCFHRIQGSTMFHEAAEYVKSELLQLGLKDATIEQFHADGKTKYWTHTSPVGWTVKSAELRLTEPEQKLLCTYEDLPQSLHTFSNATPPEGVTAELVDVGLGTKPKHYKGKNVKGKFVLATGRARAVHRQAVHKYGAAGVLTDAPMEMPNVRESIDIPDAHAYQAIWPTARELPKTKFGFSLSKRQGNQLRAYLEAGKKVKLTAKVDARLFPFYEDVITATIKGKTEPDEEIFLIAHLCHPKPSANDNASGSAVLLEVARTIKTLINTRKMDAPARTIRFMWVPETLGTIAYLAKHRDAPKRFIAGVNLDMVGQNQELCKSTLCLDRTPDSCPSFLNDLVYTLIEQSIDEFDYPTRFGLGSTFRYRTQSFSGGSDHGEFTEATTHIPCVMLLQWPDLFYHTSMDTLDKVSEDSLKRVGWITTLAALTLANATAETAYKLAQQTAAKAIMRIAEANHQATEELFKQTDPKQLHKTLAHHRNRIEHIVWREQQAIKSTRTLAKDRELDTIINKHCKNIADAGKGELEKLEETAQFIAKTRHLKLPTKPEETKTEKQLRKLVPKRRFKGSLSSDLLKDRLGEEEYEWYDTIVEIDMDFGKKMLEIVNFIDGKHSGIDILKAVSAEYTQTNPEHLLKFLKDLEKTKLITLQ